MAYTESAKRVQVSQFFSPAARVATANGSGLDLMATSGVGQHEYRCRVNVGTVTGTTPTMVVKIQESTDNSTFTDISGATTASLTAAGVTDFYFRTSNRYIRAVITLGGTSPSFTCAIDLLAFLQNV
jgi:hypothetical protein